MIYYQRGTISLPLILYANSASILKWWVDGSHVVHPTLHGHSGSCLSLGQGMPISGSMKQKLNTCSSTEIELVVADDFMPMILWTNYFLAAQGYGAKDTILYQDNQSAILLEKNGCKSSSRCTKHLNVCYYFITDHIDAQELYVHYCSTDQMIADFFTKPLQGKLFLTFHKTIMNHP